LGKLALLAKQDLIQKGKERAAAQTALKTAQADAKKAKEGKDKTAADAAVKKAEAELTKAEDREKKAEIADGKAQAALDKAQSGGSGSAGELPCNVECVLTLSVSWIKM
jgi:hypothetical protein